MKTQAGSSPRLPSLRARWPGNPKSCGRARLTRTLSVIQIILDLQTACICHSCRSAPALKAMWWRASNSQRSLGVW